MLLPHASHVRLMGPKLVINTTSLLTGERVSFSREPNTDLVDLRTPDTNIIRLSNIVGASAGVPVVFPPTPIRGDLLVDGGVADNQGIAGLTENRCDVVIVSDASGQMEALDTMGTGEAAVYMRVSSIFQFQIRDKLLDSLASRPAGSVAFVHLFLNLKDREAEEGRYIPRLTSEVIPALARIRTDLDQFSPIERESLMYHGYTLIDAILRANCPVQRDNNLSRSRTESKKRTGQTELRGEPSGGDS
jgi:predicted acylesterase/phospholipase RssA